MGKYGDLGVGRENDRRWKLSPEDIKEIKRLRRGGMVVRQIASVFGVHDGTVRYWTEPRLQAYMRAKNAKRSRSPEEERLQYANKERRRQLVRPAVREATRKQMKAWRAIHADQLRPLWAKKMAEWRRRNPEKALENQRRWWHKHKCKCHTHWRIEQ